MFFGRGVGANVDVVGAFCDLSAVDFVDDVIDVLELVGVGDDLVARYDVLCSGQSEIGRFSCSGRSATPASGARCNEATNLVDDHCGSSWMGEYRMSISS